MDVELVQVEVNQCLQVLKVGEEDLHQQIKLRKNLNLLNFSCLVVTNCLKIVEIVPR